MNELIPTSLNQRMNSLEIAEVTGKNHKDVMRDIRNLIEQGAINQRSFALVEYEDAKGEMRPMFALDFEATMTLVTGYDAKRRAAVIKRWTALERGEATPMASLHDTLCETAVINNLVGGLADIMATMNRVLGRLERLEQPAAATQLPLPGGGGRLNGVIGIRAFVAAACRLSPDAAVDKRTLYNHYRNWCRTTGEHPYDYGNFCKGLYQAGLPIRQAERRVAGGKRHHLIRGLALPCLEEVRS